MKPNDNISENGDEEASGLVRERPSRYQNELSVRLFNFAVNVLRFLEALPNRNAYSVILYQLTKSVTSLGANYEEAQGAFSKRDFISKIGICLKEAKETDYFLRIISELNLGNTVECDTLTDESDQLTRIIATILIKSRQN